VAVTMLMSCGRIERTAI